MLVKRDEASKKSVMTLLQRINDTLASKATRFLTGETLCCFDCELMPKLQHIRVAGKFFVDFEAKVSLIRCNKVITDFLDASSRLTSIN